MTWADWLTTTMDAANISAARLSRDIGVAEGTISKWRRGVQPPGVPKMVVDIAHALGQPNAIAALEAAGQPELADEVRQGIKQAYEDPFLVRLWGNRRVSQQDKATIAENYSRRKADSVRLAELEILDAIENAKREESTGTGSGQKAAEA